MKPAHCLANNLDQQAPTSLLQIHIYNDPPSQQLKCTIIPWRERRQHSGMTAACPCPQLLASCMRSPLHTPAPAPTTIFAPRPPSPPPPSPPPCNLHWWNMKQEQCHICRERASISSGGSYHDLRACCTRALVGPHNLHQSCLAHPWSYLWPPAHQDYLASRPLSGGATRHNSGPSAGAEYLLVPAHLPNDAGNCVRHPRLYDGTIGRLTDSLPGRCALSV